MAITIGNRLSMSGVFACAARSYWFDVFPQICGEIREWHRKASTIPDSKLRKSALDVHTSKRGNLEGAAAFAAFASPTNRSAVVRAQVAFQAIYDYVDTLAEQPNNDPVNNGMQLHQALLVSLDLKAPHRDYYAYHSGKSDANYLIEIIDACKTALSTLPSYLIVAEPVRRLASRIVCYQSFNLTRVQGSSATLEAWANGQTPSHSGLRWWETAASTGSSLGIFALIAMASRRHISPLEVLAVENAYFPWIGSLHSLLDSLIDLPEDTDSGQQNLITHYSSSDEMASRMKMITLESVRRSQSLACRDEHILILAGMACFYLSAKEAKLPYARYARAKVLDGLGDIAGPTMFVFNIRRGFGALSTAWSTSASR